MKDSKKYFSKILDYIEKINSLIADMDFNTFLADDRTVWACSFAVSQIGEQAKKFSEYEYKKYPQIPWNKMRGMRNIIIHEYDNVNIKVLWETITQAFPKLEKDIRQIIDL